MLHHRNEIGRIDGACANFEINIDHAADRLRNKHFSAGGREHIAIHAFRALVQMMRRNGGNASAYRTCTHGDQAFRALTPPLHDFARFDRGNRAFDNHNVDIALGLGRA